MKRKRRKRFPVQLFIFAVVVFGIVLYYTLSLPIWQIREVVVNGAHLLDPDEIRTLAVIPYNENLFFTSFARARSNLRKIPAIEKFSLHRLPPATVLISITERKPIAVAVLKDQSLIIDKDGYIINANRNLKLNLANMTNLPVVSGVDASKIQENRRLGEMDAKIIAGIVVELSKFLEPQKLQIKFGGYQDISFLLDDIMLVRVGRPEDFERKMFVFNTLFNTARDKWKQIDYIDVRFPENPVIKYK